jgi:hypothetical protein
MPQEPRPRPGGVERSDLRLLRSPANGGPLPRHLHLYLDESVRLVGEAQGQVLLVGALSLPAPLGFHPDDWYLDLLRRPHANEIPDQEMDGMGRKQARVLEAVAKRRIRGLGFSVLATLVAEEGGKPGGSYSRPGSG